MQRTIGEIWDVLNTASRRTAWERGVLRYAYDLFGAYVDSLGIHDLQVRIGKISEADLLRGAESWQQYSAMGRALIWDRDICLRLGTKYQIQKTERGQKQPARGGTWAELQAKALGEAAQIVIAAVNWRAER